jgi:hypothetical protein
MTRLIFLLLCCLLGSHLYAQQITGKPPLDSIALNKYYSDMKTGYALYEKEHGNYIQTNNVKMHSSPGANGLLRRSSGFMVQMVMVMNCLKLQIHWLRWDCM